MPYNKKIKKIVIEWKPSIKLLYNDADAKEQKSLKLVLIYLYLKYFFINITLRDGNDEHYQFEHSKCEKMV